MGKTHVSVETKLAAVRRVLEEGDQVSVIASELGLHRDTIYRWINTYKLKGEQGLINPRSTTSIKASPSQVEAEKRIKELE
ncbi:helix-turn-helix domain-containing protein, partial [Evansella clarkii]